MTVLEKIVAVEGALFFLALFLLAAYYRQLAEHRDGQLRRLVARELLAAS